MTQSDRYLPAEVCERMRRDAGSVFPALANTGDPFGPVDARRAAQLRRQVRCKTRERALGASTGDKRIMCRFCAQVLCFSSN